MKPEITHQNFEDYLLLAIDGELNATEQATFDAFLAAHPELSAVVAGYAATVVPLPEPVIVFDGKEALLKPELPIRKTMAYRPVWWAAAALLLLSAGTYITLQKSGSTPPIATVPTPAKNPSAILPEQLPAPLPETAADPITPAPKNLRTAVPTIASQPRQQQPVGPLTVQGNPPQPAETIAALPIIDRPLSETSLPELTFPEVSQPVATVAVALPQAEKGTLAINLPLLGHLREAAAEKAAQVRTARQAIKNTEATVAVAGYELFTIRF